MNIRNLDLNSLFGDGFDSIALPRDTFIALRDTVQGLDWLKDHDGVFNRIPAFLLTASMQSREEKAEQERAMNKLSLENCPEDLMAQCQALLRDQRVMGDWLMAFDPSIQFVSVWDGAEDLDWHWDGPACADFFFLIYLNKELGWSEDRGGQLCVGKRLLQGNYLHVDKQDVLMKGAIDPSSRTLVCCNNQNPQFVHKVIPLSGDAERTVLMIGFDMLRFSGSETF